MKAASSNVRNPPFETECVAFFSEVVQVFGVPKSVGQIYGLLYASPTPLSFSDIVERQDISKGSASQGLQLLRSLGAVRIADAQREATGDRRKAILSDKEPNALSLRLAASGASAARCIAYEPELSLRKLVSGVLQERIAPLATTGTDRLARLRELAEQTGRGTTSIWIGRSNWKAWRRRLRTVLPMLNLLLGPKSRK